MKIFITGNQGFIGKRLLEKIAIDNALKEVTKEQIVVKGWDDDYFKFSDWRKRLKVFLDDFNPNVIFHVGACSDTMEQDANFMMVRNYESTKIISNWAKSKNVPLIYSSSAAIYGTNNEYPSNLYGWSKYVAEDFVHNNGGVSLRYFNVYGPGEEHKGAMASVAHQMFMKNKNGEEVKLFPNKPTRDFVYIDDVVDANIFAFKNYDKLKSDYIKYYEVGSGVARTFEDVMEILDIEYSYHDESVIPVGYQFGTKSDFWMEGWGPKFTLESGLTEYKKYLENS